MRFQILSTITALVAASSVSAQLKPQTVVDAIEKITDLSRDTTDVAEDIENPITLIPNGFKLVNNFKDIISTAVSTIPKLADAKGVGFPEDGQSEICEAFRTFVVVHQKLLNVVIGKDSLLSRTPVANVLAQVLRTLEGGVDKLAFLIIDLVPTCADGAKSDLMKLDDTIGKAIDTYS